MDAIRLAEAVEARYLKYLSTTFYFRDPELRDSFETALKSGRLSKGPYLEATPVFRRTRSLIDLCRELQCYNSDESFFLAVAGDRMLYKHQDEAIRAATQDRKNVIVATGTGSGKTEAFLLPILLHLYNEFRTGTLKPGVRALILYPMNALASDQRDRLGEICRNLQQGSSPFRFTFGQYTGETPEDEQDTRRHADDQSRHRRPGELIFRAEMRSAPPHILLTNYSMLEYLLLRPDDSPLFDAGKGRNWRFIVLDEAHQYRGARGIEMAMLLRRLKRRIIEGGRENPFTCIATSATLMGGEADKSAVARFAAELFGEAFDATDVILGETERTVTHPSTTLSVHEYERLSELTHQGVTDKADLIFQIAESNNLAVRRHDAMPESLGALLLEDLRVAKLLSLISDRPQRLEKIATEIFADAPPDTRISALSTLVTLLVFAQHPGSKSPLLNARYHLFLRGLEGAFVSYWPRKSVQLERSKGQSIAFEVALCRECGQHYLVGKRGSNMGQLHEAVRDPGHEDFGADFFRPIEIGEIGNAPEEPPSPQSYMLCTRCGEIGKKKPGCGHPEILTVVKERAPDDDDKADQISRCGFCGYSGSGRDPVREIIHGTDGPHAVIATTLYRNMPQERRKILAFTDGRQEAAFFAWYLEKSYNDILTRNLIHQALTRLRFHAPEGLSLRELSNALAALYREMGISPPAAGDLEVRRAAWRDIYAEFLTDEPRLSLEGVGLASWDIKWPPWFNLPPILRQGDLSLNDDEASGLMFLLLDTMRSDRAVEINTAEGISLAWPDLGIRAYQTKFRIGPPLGRKDTKSWDGQNGRRARLITKFLNCGRTTPESLAQSSSILRSIWERIVADDELAPSSKDKVLLSVEDAHRLNPDWWRLSSIAADAVVFRCDTCGRLQTTCIRGICPRHMCPGRLMRIHGREVDNHYRLLYEENLPGRMSVEEHTAQLDYEKAREYQRLFKQGQINILSCSTTFELGVDLGDLDVTFLRNVPPEAFNYAQRVGRVGRRSGHPGFAVTYSRRSPHDLYHFEEPLRLLTGRVQPPSFRLSNERIILRHVTATSLSVYFREHRQRFGTVESLCRNLEKPSSVADFREFLLKARTGIERSLRAIVPEKAHGLVGLCDGKWVDKIAGEDSRLNLAESETSSDFRIVKQLRLESFERGDDRSVAWAGARMKTLAQEDVLSFLSRKAVIPKYGFPVDVVELDTQPGSATATGAAVALQRDLAIAVAEFAPTSSLIANKRIWTSYALKRVIEREWDRWWYARCPLHGRFERQRFGGDSPAFDKCCDKMKMSRVYVEPRFGFVTNRDKPEAPTGRPAKIFTTRPYFAGWKEGEGEVLDFRVLHLTKATPGYMVVLCEGRAGGGFFICGQCGAGFRKRGDFQRGHKTPYGTACPSRPESLCPPVSLGHEILSDVVKLQFLAPYHSPMDPTWFAFSLAYAIVEGTAEALEVPSADLNATVAYAGTDALVSPIVLYDTVPGGAGLVSRLEDKQALVTCLRAAFKRVSNCSGCGEDSSCYSCLRNYRNQFAHLNLRRGPTAAYLKHVLAVLE